MNAFENIAEIGIGSCNCFEFFLGATLIRMYLKYGLLIGVFETLLGHCDFFIEAEDSYAGAEVIYGALISVLRGSGGLYLLLLQLQLPLLALPWPWRSIL